MQNTQVTEKVDTIKQDFNKVPVITREQVKEILYYTTPEVKRKWMKGLKVKYNDDYHKFFAPKKDDRKRV